MGFKKYINEMEEWKYTVDDEYQTLNINKNKLKDLFNNFVYSLPKKYSTKKKVLADIRKDGIRVSPKEFNAYIDGLDESRLEELVGFINDSIDKWDGV